MAEHTIPVDLLNPGQVFACLGFLETADSLLGDAEGSFTWTGGHDPEARFHLRAVGDSNPVEAVLAFLSKAEVHALAPADVDLATDKWSIPLTVSEHGAPFPSPIPNSPATLPALLISDGQSLILDHWADTTSRDNVKFWAGAAGYPGAALARDALDIIQDKLDDAAKDPFSISDLQSSSFRFDWRRDYVPLDTGFSPNEHGNIRMVGCPLVELMAVLGLSHARPLRLSKLEYRYGIVGQKTENVFLDPMFLRAALGCATLPFPQRTFHMQLGWPGQENQARCILDVTEEPVS